MAATRPVVDVLNEALLSGPYTTGEDLQRAVQEEIDRANAASTGQKAADAFSGVVNEIKSAFSGGGNKTLAYVVIALVAFAVLSD